MQRIAFVGDTLFAMGCGRLFEGTPSKCTIRSSGSRPCPKKPRSIAAHEYTLANARFAAHAEPENAAIAARLAEVEALREAGESPFRRASRRNVKPIPSFAPLRWKSSRGSGRRKTASVHKQSRLNRGDWDL